MKKGIPAVCYTASAVSVVAFVVKSIADYAQYSAAFTSAPFYVCLPVNALYFLLPAVIVFLVGFIAGSKQKRPESKRGIPGTNAMHQTERGEIV